MGCFNLPQLNGTPRSGKGCLAVHHDLCQTTKWRASLRAPLPSAPAHASRPAPPQPAPRHGPPLSACKPRRAQRRCVRMCMLPARQGKGTHTVSYKRERPQLSLPHHHANSHAMERSGAAAYLQGSRASIQFAAPRGSCTTPVVVTCVTVSRFACQPWGASVPGRCLARQLSRHLSLAKRAVGSRRW